MEKLIHFLKEIKHILFKNFFVLYRNVPYLYRNKGKNNGSTTMKITDQLGKPGKGRCTLSVQEE